MGKIESKKTGRGRWKRKMREGARDHQSGEAERVRDRKREIARNKERARWSENCI